MSQTAFCMMLVFQSSLLSDSNLDPYGFERPEDFDYKSYEQFMESYMGMLVRRAMKWEAMISKSSRLNSRRGMKSECFFQFYDVPTLNEISVS